MRSSGNTTGNTTNTRGVPQDAAVPAASAALTLSPARQNRPHRRQTALWAGLLGVSLCGASGKVATAQASAAGVRAGDLQVGGGFSLTKPDYGQDNLRGFTFYSSFDFKPNFGVEIDFHQQNAPSPSKIYERTYEVGGRYVRHYNIFNPYARVMYGRGVFNYQYDVANLAYNMGVLGAGVDINVHRHINVRADYEYQHWFGFRGNLNTDSSDSLSPQVFTIGAAYHFE